MTDVTTLTGRELDRAVAEAKGYQYTVGDVCTGPDGKEYLFYPPHYSRDWAAAGPLLVEMEDEEPELGRDTRGWYVHLYMSDRWFYGDTPTEVIARARVAWKTEPR